jgi:hypothetical protein
VQDWSKLKEQTLKTRLDFIITDLDLLFTFADLVETEHELGNHEHARRTLAEAEKGYEDMLRLFSTTEDLTPETQNAFSARFNELRELLDSLHELVNKKC